MPAKEFIFFSSISLSALVRGYFRFPTFPVISLDIFCSDVGLGGGFNNMKNVQNHIFQFFFYIAPFYEE